MEKDLSKGPRAKKSDPKYIKHIIRQKLSKKEASHINPVILAWIGDGIFSDAVRKYLTLASPSKIGKLHSDSVYFVRAQSQSSVVHKLINTDLNEEEIRIVKSGRNSNTHIPKNASVSEYRYATGFETLLGWLSLTGQQERLEHLCAQAISELIKDEAE